MPDLGNQLQYISIFPFINENTAHLARMLRAIFKRNYWSVVHLKLYLLLLGAKFEGITT